MRARVLAAAALVLALAACQSAGAPSPSASPSPIVTSSTPSPSPTPTPSPTPSPTPTATAQGCPAWTDNPDAMLGEIDTNRFEGACIGDSFATAAANGTVVHAVSQCPWYGDIVAQDSVGLYVSAVSDPANPGGAIKLFRMEWLGDPVEAQQYEVPRTPEGVTIGSTKADVLAAYPGASQVTFDDISRGPRTQLVWSNPDGNTYAFDIVDNVVAELTWGQGIGGGGPNGEFCAL